ncbi:TatD family hydrolase [Candidatus Falkowbacteria bacterium]|nr:TatD family hydrolase [Candidatus Falkowbacteria bacterium]
MLIDSHCHVNFNAYRDDADATIQRSLDKEIWLINVGSQLSTSQRSITLAQKYPEGVYAAVGLHPIHLAQDITESAKFDGQEYAFTTRRETFEYDRYKQLAQSSSKVVALGEVGLDYYYFGEVSLTPEEMRKVQQETLDGFLALAKELQLPVIFHCRGAKDNPHQAYDDLYDCLAESGVRGVVHCFGGSLEQAKKFVDLGLYVGFTGIITFKNAEELRAIAVALPLDRILVETDAPFLAPDPYRGKRNEPAYVEYVAKTLAEARGVDFEHIAEATVHNTRQLFSL